MPIRVYGVLSDQVGEVSYIQTTSVTAAAREFALRQPSITSVLVLDPLGYETYCRIYRREKGVRVVVKGKRVAC